MSGTDQPAEQAPSTPDAAAQVDRTDEGRDPLRASRTSGIWLAVVALLVVLMLLAVFILQNTDSVEIRYFGWSGRAPLAAALLIAAAAGLALAVAAGTLRILQLRRRVRRQRP